MHHITCATDPHTATGVNIGNINSNKSSINSSKVGRPKLAQSNTCSICPLTMCVFGNCRQMQAELINGCALEAICPNLPADMDKFKS